MIDELPIQSPGSWKLAVWADSGSGYQPPLIRTFTAFESASTYCELYGPYPSGFRGFPAPRANPEAMPERWRFTVAGCCDLEAKNCSCLNGEWVIVRQKRHPAGHRWVLALNGSFADPQLPCFWRLMFNEPDGFWYLDCVGNLDQAPGTWISYRLHESGWEPQGPNVLHLYTNSRYCNVPATLTLIPV
jgi:hypothetical protein